MTPLIINGEPQIDAIARALFEAWASGGYDNRAWDTLGTVKQESWKRAAKVAAALVTSGPVPVDG